MTMLRLCSRVAIATLAALPVWLVVAFSLHALLGGAS